MKLTPQDRSESLRNCKRYYFSHGYKYKSKEIERQESRRNSYLWWREIVRYYR